MGESKYSPEFLAAMKTTAEALGISKAAKPEELTAASLIAIAPVFVDIARSLDLISQKIAAG